MMQALEDRKLACFGTPSDRRHERRILYWTLAWSVLFVLAAMALKFDWVEPGLPATLLTLATAIPGIGVLLAYVRLLREGDELRRKIEMEALALAFGVGVLGGLTYELVGEAGWLPEADVNNLLVGMILTYVGGVLYGRWRYA